MASDVEGTPSQNLPQREAPFHQHNHPPLPLPHHHHPHHHHHHLLPRPFLCANCKCWNFPVCPNFNPHVNRQHQALAHLHNLQAHAESADSMRHQDLNVGHQAENLLSDRCGTDEMEGDEEEEYQFVMTDEWMEFFAKSEARRQEKKRQQKKAARDLRKATRARSQAEEPSQHIR